MKHSQKNKKDSVKCEVFFRYEVLLKQMCCFFLMRDPEKDFVGRSWQLWAGVASPEGGVSYLVMLGKAMAYLETQTG